MNLTKQNKLMIGVADNFKNLHFPDIEYIIRDYLLIHPEKVKYYSRPRYNVYQLLTHLAMNDELVLSDKEITKEVLLAEIIKLEELDDGPVD